MKLICRGSRSAVAGLPRAVRVMLLRLRRGEHEHARLRGVAQVRDRHEAGLAQHLLAGVRDTPHLGRAVPAGGRGLRLRGFGRLRFDAQHAQFVELGRAVRLQVVELLDLARLQVDRLALLRARQARAGARQDRFADEGEGRGLAPVGDTTEDDQRLLRRRQRGLQLELLEFGQLRRLPAACSAAVRRT